MWRAVSAIGSIAWAYLAYSLGVAVGFDAASGVLACTILSIALAIHAVEDKP
jgi:hypothetical protein